MVTPACRSPAFPLWAQPLPTPTPIPLPPNFRQSSKMWHLSEWSSLGMYVQTFPTVVSFLEELVDVQLPACHPPEMLPCDVYFSLPQWETGWGAALALAPGGGPYSQRAQNPPEGSTEPSC